MAYKILVIEDEPEMQLMLRDNLECEGYQVVSAETGERGVELGLAMHPDLVLLDVILPHMSGYSVCQKLRTGGCKVPIIMITARNAEIDRIAGLDLGADDYIGKPFSVYELMARVRAQLRRVGQVDAMETEKLTIGRVVIDTARHEVYIGDSRLDLSAKEVDLLHYLIRNEGVTISRDQLLTDVWGYPDLPLTRTVDVFVARLRSKIEENPHRPRHIITVHGIGYRFTR